MCWCSSQNERGCRERGPLPTAAGSVPAPAFEQSLKNRILLTSPMQVIPDQHGHIHARRQMD